MTLPDAEARAPVALVADDGKTNRLVLSAMLERRGYEVLEAVNGREAVRVFRENEVDIVFMDVLMPEMDGYEATRAIKAICGDRFVPVMCITSLSQDESLVDCIEAGADDFIPKPFEESLLDARLKALERIQALHASALSQRDDLRDARARTLHEQRIAADVVRRYTRWDSDSAPNVRTSLKAAEIFNGDVFMVARSPSGTQRIFLGDATGHGLPAAVCAIPASELFQTLTARGVTLEETCRALNRRLHSVVPSGLFVAGVLIDLDFRQGILSIWNGGLPPVYYCEPGRGVMHTFESRHVPLAIQSESQFQARVESIPFEPEGRLYLHTDGLVEIPDLDDDAEDLLLETLDSVKDLGAAFDLVQDRMSEARGRLRSHDDATFIEIMCTAPDPVKDTATGRVEDSSWDYAVRFDSAALRRVDLLPIVTPVMESMVPELGMREVALTVLGELFTNALDHGVLGLSSQLKDGAGGFERYLAARARALSDLDHGSIAVQLESEQSGQAGRISIKVRDSGPGFERNDVVSSNGDANTRPSGRGIALIEELCSSVVYSERGNEVEAILSW